MAVVSKQELPIAEGNLQGKLASLLREILGDDGRVIFQHQKTPRIELEVEGEFMRRILQGDHKVAAGSVDLAAKQQVPHGIEPARYRTLRG